MKKGVCYFILGSIGSGKSEVAKRLLFSEQFNSLIYIGANACKYKYFNQPDIGKKAYCCADELSFYLMQRACEEGKDFMYELCPTNHNKIDSIRTLLNKYNYNSVGFFIGTASADINVNRVRERTKLGKDYIDEAKVRRRYLDSLSSIKQLLDIVNILYFIDNSETEDKMQVIARYEKKSLSIFFDHCSWFNDYVKEVIQ